MTHDINIIDAAGKATIGLVVLILLMGVGR